MVIMAEISSLSPPLDFKEEGLGENEGCYGPVTQSERCDFNKRELKERKVRENERFEGELRRDL